MSNPLRKTMVYLGLADEEVEYEQSTAAHAPAAPAAPSSSSSGQRAPVTPLRRPSSTRGSAPSHDMNEILTVHPRRFNDAEAIAESFREGIPVIMNLTQMSEPDARRLIDFASGLSIGLYGRIEQGVPPLTRPRGRERRCGRRRARRGRLVPRTRLIRGRKRSGRPERSA